MWGLGFGGVDSGRCVMVCGLGLGVRGGLVGFEVWDVDVGVWGLGLANLFLGFVFCDLRLGVWVWTCGSELCDMSCWACVCLLEGCSLRLEWAGNIGGLGVEVWGLGLGAWGLPFPI